MRIIVLLLVVMNMALAQEVPIPTTDPFLTEDANNPLPGTVPSTDGPPFVKTVQEADKAPPKGDKTKDHRADSTGTILVGYQPWATWIPMKKALSYTHIFNQDWSLELEYTWSKLDLPIPRVDLGDITERRYTLMAKRYFGNSFHLDFGLFYNDFEAQLGSKILDNVTGTRTSSFIGSETAGLCFNIGNRWQWSNGITFGIDWLRTNIPIVVTEVESKVLGDITDDNDHEDLKDVIRKLGRLPTFVVLGLNIGYTF